ASLGYATPGAVIAVGILIAVAWIDRGMGRTIEALTGQPAGLLVGGTLVALLYGYLARFFSVAYAPVESGLARIRPSLEAA
ncbi:iron ABC transporter permease, partial [Acinetobacter baumannii]